MLKYIYKKQWRMLLSALCTILLGCIFFGLSLMGGTPVNALIDGVPPITTINDPIYDFEKYCYSESALKSLAVNILDRGDSQTFDDLINYAKNTAGTDGKAINRKDITLKYGRYRFTPNSPMRDLVWMPVYLSKSNSGDAILTLYLAATTKDVSTSQQEVAYFSSYGTYSTAPSANTPSNSYGTSSMRAVTLGNGGTYSYYNTGANIFNQYEAEIKAMNCNKFENFISGSDFVGILNEDIVAPEQIAWQAHESYADTRYFTGNTLCWPNEAYDTPSAGTYYMPGFFDYSKKINYNSWKDNKVWLPSLTEVGNGDIDANNVDTTNGIWKLTANQRGNSTKSWLRTAKTNESKNGNNYSAYTMFCIDTDGSITSGDVNEMLAVRPAIHLNLSKIKDKTIEPIVLPEVVSTVYNGEEQVITDVPEENRKWYDESIMTISFFTDEEYTRMVAPQDAGEYFMMVQLKNTNKHFLGEDPSVTIKVTKFVIEKKELQVEFIYDTVNETLPVDVRIVDEENAIYDRDKDANFVPKIGMKYNNVAGIALKDPFSYPDIKGTYEATAYIKNEDIYNYNYKIAGNIKSSQFLVKERNISLPKFIAPVLSDNESLNAAGNDLRLSYKGKRYIQIANISKYVSIEVSARDSAAKDSIIDCALRDDGVQVYLVETCSDYTFTVSLKDTINTQWESSTESTKDTIPKTLQLHVAKAEISVKFNDSLPASWENAREMEVGLDISGIYEEIGDKLDMSVYYQRAGQPITYLQKNSSGKYVIPKGLAKGTYTLGAVIANNGQWTGNYYMDSAVTRKFEIVATVPQFNDSNAIWTYTVDGVATNKNITFTEHASESDPLILTYGHDYAFSLTMLEAVLANQYLRAVYSGDTYTSVSGLHSVTVTITAYNKYVEFTDKSYTLYYMIEPTTYDLSSVKWNYVPGETHFIFNGKEQKVMLDPDTLPEGLTAVYKTNGLGTNAVTNGGTYLTTVEFIVSPDYATNYRVPVAGDPDSYTDASENFSFTCTWTIEPYVIEVDWTSGDSSADVFFVPQLVFGSSFVDYVYELNTADGWVAKDSVTMPQGASDKYRVKAILKSEYSGNYSLNGSEWHEFTVLSGKQPVNVHFEVNNVECNDGDMFTYTGTEFTVTPVVDSGNATITSSSVEYYTALAGGTKGTKLDGAPVNVGKYIAVVAVTFENGYLAGDNEVTFEIVKANFNDTALKWEYIHDDKPTGLYVLWDADQKKWVNTHGEEIIFSFEYDGKEHRLQLLGKEDIEGLEIETKWVDGYINAGEYTSGIAYKFDSLNFNEPQFPKTIAWKIAKAKIHFENVKWGYIGSDGAEHEFDFENDKFTFTRDENGPVFYKVALINLPAGVSDKISYATTDMQKENSTPVPGNSYAAVGKYETRIADRRISYIGNDNVEAFTGDLPAFIPSFCIWEINSRELTPPEYDHSWHEFDDKVHNLMDMCGIPEEERCYYKVTVQFVDPEYNIYEDYEGYEGEQFAAFYAGTYTIRFYELGADETTEALKWQVEVVVDREVLTVIWDTNGSIPVARVSGLYISEILETVYTNESGGEVSREYVLSTEGVLFFAEPRIREKYSSNLTFKMAENNAPKVSFKSSQYKPDSKSVTLEKPVMLKEEMEFTGEEITFEIAAWAATYADFLYLTGDSLVQTEIGEYTVVINFKKYNADTGEGNAYWANTEGNRSSYELHFRIVKPTHIAIDYPKFDKTVETSTGATIQFSVINWVVLKDYIEYTCEGLTEVKPGVFSQSKPGIYTVTFTFSESSNGYWKDNKTRNAYTVSITILGQGGTITEIAKPVLEFTERVYSGSPIAFKYLNEDYYKDYLVITEGSLLATNVGTYTVTLSIKDGLGITFTDGSTSVVLTFKITPPDDPNLKVKLKRPSLLVSSKQYTGYAITFEIADWDSLSNYLTVEGLLTRTDVGTYTVVVKFKEDANAEWADGGKDDVVLTFKITEGASVQPQIIELPQMVVAEKEYTGSDISFEIKDFLNNLDKLIQIKDVGYGYLVKSQVGEYSFYVQIMDPVSYKWADGTTEDKKLTFRIVPANVQPNDITSDSEGHLNFNNGDGNKVNIDDYIEYVYKDKDGNVVDKADLKDGEEYTYTVKLKDDKAEEFNKNFVNAELLRQIIESKTFTFVYSSSKGLSPILIITISVIGVLVFLVVATIIVLAVKRRQYVDDYDDDYDYYNDYDDYEEDDE